MPIGGGIKSVSNTNKTYIIFIYIRKKNVLIKKGIYTSNPNIMNNQKT